VLGESQQSWLSSWLLSLRWCRCCCGEGGESQEAQSCHTFCECHQAAVVGHIMVVVVQWKGKLLIGNAGAGGSWLLSLRPSGFATAVTP